MKTLERSYTHRAECKRQMSEKEELLPSQERFTFTTGPELDKKLREAAHRLSISKGKMIRKFVEEGVETILSGKEPQPCLELDPKLFQALETVAERLGLQPEGLLNRMILDHLVAYLQEAQTAEEKVKNLEQKIKGISKVSHTEQKDGRVENHRP